MHVPAERDLGQVDLRRLVHEHAVLAGYQLGGARSGQADVSGRGAGTGRCRPASRRNAAACRGQADGEPGACSQLLQDHGSPPHIAAKTTAREPSMKTTRGGSFRASLDMRRLTAFLSSGSPGSLADTRAEGF